MSEQTPGKKTQELMTTAKTEIVVNRQEDGVLKRLEDDWKKTRDKIAETPVSAPTLDYGYQEPRSVQKEYNEAKAKHDQRRELATDSFAQIRAATREEGRTLSDTYAMSAPNFPDIKTHFGNSSPSKGLSLIHI